MNIEEVIAQTVQETVAHLKAAGLLREDTRSAAEKTGKFALLWWEASCKIEKNKEVFP